MRFIYMQQMSIGIIGAQKLVTTLKENKTIEKLSSIPVKSLKENVKEITELKLCGSFIGDLEAIVLATLLGNNTTIKEINLSKNQITDIGAKAFANVLELVKNTPETTAWSGYLMNDGKKNKIKFRKFHDKIKKISKGTVSMDSLSSR
eukprot:TRINITY_DN3654_c0_g1_i1.p1 TRINITY_DN3654_c0_g1~~TRINITY_DN3654_c0_g1_i1.p1  ORF type:complete len:148 (+),score=22.41 TRINITY_DN3654_c0_g1_i1:184-627(+)